MSFKIIIAENTLEKARIWENSIGDIPEITVIQSTPADLWTRVVLDAELMAWIFVHERYGGRPQFGVSQILSTHGEPNAPPWVITTIPLPAKGHWGVNAEGKGVWVDEGSAPATPTEMFAAVFSAITKHNAEQKSPIWTLGFSGSMLFLNDEDRIEATAQALREVYLEWRDRIADTNS